jgi:hypothetical protein
MASSAREDEAGDGLERLSGLAVSRAGFHRARLGRHLLNADIVARETKEGRP